MAQVSCPIIQSSHHANNIATAAFNLQCPDPITIRTREFNRS